MKPVFFRTATAFLVAVAALSLTVAPALAQRTDSLMTKADVIIPVYDFYKTQMNGFLYYLADDGRTGFELWRTDGTVANTKLVKDIRPGRASAFIPDSSNYLTATYNSSQGKYVYDAATAKQSLASLKFYSQNNKLYFWANDGLSGTELWQSDGTEIGTTRITDIIAGPFDSATMNDMIYGSFNFTQNQNKVVFRSGLIPDYLFETDGTATGTREINIRTNKYVSAYVSDVQVVNNQLFAKSSIFSSGTTYYTLLQDNGGSTAPTAVVTNAPGPISVLDNDARGPLWSVQTEDSKQRSTTIFRQEAGKAKVVKRFDFAKSPTSTPYPNVSLIGRSGDQIVLMAANDALYGQTGKGTRELWRIDARTDSVQLVRRFVNDQTVTSNETRFTKGSEAVNYYFNTPTGLFFVHQLADVAGTAYRHTASYYDPATNKLRAVEDSIENNFRYWSYGPKSQILFVSRKTVTEPYRVWTTNGQTKQTLKTLGVADATLMDNTDIGLVSNQLTANYNAKKVFIGYKQEVWKLDTVAANVTQIGRVSNGAYIGAPFASNGVLYGNNSGYMIRVSSATPADSIRFVALVSNYADYGKGGNFLGTINGRLIGRPTSSSLLMAIDPAGRPKKCTVSYIPFGKTISTSTSLKTIGLCPAKDSVVTLRRSFVSMSNATGEINSIYYNTYQWLRDSTVLQTGSSDSLKLRPQSVSEFAITLRGQADGCQATDTYRVAYNNPAVSLIPNLQQADRIGITALPSGGAAYDGNYYLAEWKRDNVATKVNGGTITSVVTVGSQLYLDELVNTKSEPRYGTYNVKITDASGCTATSSYIFDDKTTFLTLKGGFVNIPASNYVCDQSLVSYTALAGGGKEPYTYRWRNYTIPIGTGATGSFVVKDASFSKIYYVEATDADGKKAISASTELFTNPLPNAQLTVTDPAASATKPAILSALVTNYSSPTFAWAKDGQVVAGVTGRSFTATSGGVYSVTVNSTSNSSTSCRRIVATTLVTGSGRVASPEAVAAQSLRVSGEPMPDGTMTLMPNPTQDISRVQLDLPKPAGIRGTLLSSDGRVLQEWRDDRPFVQYNAEVNLSSQPVGVYILRIEADGKVYSRKVMKQ